MPKKKSPPAPPAPAIKFRLTDGRIIEAVKDCGCVTHVGPHWLYMDAFLKEKNSHYNLNTFLGRLAHAREEHTRLTEKLSNMRRLGIEEIIYPTAETESPT